MSTLDRQELTGKRTKYAPLLLSLGLMAVVIAYALNVSLKNTDGQLVYALDDAYFHMATAKNFVEHGVWGVTKYGFTSSVSSILWPTLIAGADYAFGYYNYIPLFLNSIISILILIMINRFALTSSESTAFLPLLIFLLTVIFCTPLVALVFSGMEHTLHILFSVLILYYGSRLLTNSEGSRRELLLVCFSGALLVLSRYEGLFMIASLGGLLLLSKRYGAFLALLVSSVSPLILYGLISVLQGWEALPNSLLLKGSLPDEISVKSIRDWLFFGAYRNLFLDQPALTVLVAVNLLIMFITNPAVNNLAFIRVMCSLFLLTCLLHLLFASVGWFYRYEAYLYAMAIMGPMLFILNSKNFFREIYERWQNTSPQWIGNRIYFISAILSSIIFIAAPLSARAYISCAHITKAIENNYLEHIMPARFLQRYFSSAHVVLSDIGAAAYLSDVKILDAYGLASLYPLQCRKSSGGYTAKDLDAWSREHKAPIAILQTEWADIARVIPDNWIKVAQWKIPHNVIFGDTTVVFFATGPMEPATIKRYLTEFQKTAPPKLELVLF